MLKRIQDNYNLQPGLDFRKPEYRRAVWMKFYKFHLKHRSHPGCVYYLMPYLFEALNMDEEQRLWFCFLNGNTQNPLTSYILFKRFNRPPKNTSALIDYFYSNAPRLEFDLDRWRQKMQFPDSLEAYLGVTGTVGTQGDFFRAQFVPTGSSQAQRNYKNLYPIIRKHFHTLGRMSTFSYMEYLRIAGVELECDDLCMTDEGSKSHRNGLAKVLGRDDLDYHPSSNPGFDGKYTDKQLEELTREGKNLLNEARVEFEFEDFAHDVGYFTLESALCTYKSWFRKNRRYPNVYNDMLFYRIKSAEKKYPEEDLSIFWDARRECTPPELLLEANTKDPGLCKEKQNHFRETGQVVMMNYDDPIFKNSFNDKYLYKP